VHATPMHGNDEESRKALTFRLSNALTADCMID
jgi:hypothetical protein